MSDIVALKSQNSRDQGVRKLQFSEPVAAGHLLDNGAGDKLRTLDTETRDLPFPAKGMSDEPTVITFPIRNFWKVAKQQNDIEGSDIGYCRGFYYRLLIHPKGTVGTDSESSHLSVFLEAIRQKWFPHDWVFPNVRFELTVVNFKDPKQSVSSWAHWSFSGEATSRGWQKMLSHSRLSRLSGFMDEEGTVLIRGKAEPLYSQFWSQSRRYAPQYLWSLTSTVISHSSVASGCSASTAEPPGQLSKSGGNGHGKPCDQQTAGKEKHSWLSYIEAMKASVASSLDQYRNTTALSLTTSPYIVLNQQREQQQKQLSPNQIKSVRSSQLTSSPKHLASVSSSSSSSSSPRALPTEKVSTHDDIMQSSLNPFISDNIQSPDPLDSPYSNFTASTLLPMEMASMFQLCNHFVPSLKTALHADFVACFTLILYHIREFRREIFLWNTAFVPLQMDKDNPSAPTSDAAPGPFEDTSSQPPPRKSSLFAPESGQTVIEALQTTFAHLYLWPLVVLVVKETFAMSSQDSPSLSKPSPPQLSPPSVPRSTARDSNGPHGVYRCAQSETANSSSNCHISPFSPVPLKFTHWLKHQIVSLSVIPASEMALDRNIHFNNNLADIAWLMYALQFQPSSKHIMKILGMHDVQKIDIADHLPHIHVELFSMIHRECQIAYVAHVYKQAVMETQDPCHTDIAEPCRVSEDFACRGSSCDGQRLDDALRAMFSISSPKATHDTISSGDYATAFIRVKHVHSMHRALELSGKKFKRCPGILFIYLSQQRNTKKGELFDVPLRLNISSLVETDPVASDVSQMGPETMSQTYNPLFGCSPSSKPFKEEPINLETWGRQSEMKGAMTESKPRDLSDAVAWSGDPERSKNQEAVDSGFKSSPYLSRRANPLSDLPVMSSNSEEEEDDDDDDDEIFVDDCSDPPPPPFRFSQSDQSPRRSTQIHPPGRQSKPTKPCCSTPSKPMISSSSVSSTSSSKSEHWYCLFAVIIREGDANGGSRHKAQTTHTLLLRPEEDGPWYRICQNRVEMLVPHTEFTEWKCHRDFFCAATVYVSEDYIDATVNDDVDNERNLRELNPRLYKKTLDELGISEQEALTLLKRGYQQYLSRFRSDPANHASMSSSPSLHRDKKSADRQRNLFAYFSTDNLGSSTVNPPSVSRSSLSSTSIQPPQNQSSAHQTVCASPPVEHSTKLLSLHLPTSPLSQSIFETAEFRNGCLLNNSFYTFELSLAYLYHYYETKAVEVLFELGKPDVLAELMVRMVADLYALFYVNAESVLSFLLRCTHSTPRSTMSKALSSSSPPPASRLLRAASDTNIQPQIQVSQRLQHQHAFPSSEPVPPFNSDLFSGPWREGPRDNKAQHDLSFAPIDQSSRSFLRRLSDHFVQVLFVPHTSSSKAELQRLAQMLLSVHDLIKKGSFDRIPPLSSTVDSPPSPPSPSRSFPSDCFASRAPCPGRTSSVPTNTSHFTRLGESSLSQRCEGPIKQDPSSRARENPAFRDDANSDNIEAHLEKYFEQIWMLTASCVNTFKSELKNGLKLSKEFDLIENDGPFFKFFDLELDIIQGFEDMLSTCSSPRYHPDPRIGTTSPIPHTAAPLPPFYEGLHASELSSPSFSHLAEVSIFFLPRLAVPNLICSAATQYIEKLSFHALYSFAIGPQPSSKKSECICGPSATALRHPSRSDAKFLSSALGGSDVASSTHLYYSSYLNVTLIDAMLHQIKNQRAQTGWKARLRSSLDTHSLSPHPKYLARLSQSLVGEDPADFADLENFFLALRRKSIAPSRKSMGELFESMRLTLKKNKEDRDVECLGLLKDGLGKASSESVQGKRRRADSRHQYIGSDKKDKNKLIYKIRQKVAPPSESEFTRQKKLNDLLDLDRELVKTITQRVLQKVSVKLEPKASPASKVMLNLHQKMVHQFDPDYFVSEAAAQELFEGSLAGFVAQCSPPSTTTSMPTIDSLSTSSSNFVESSFSKSIAGIDLLLNSARIPTNFHQIVQLPRFLRVSVNIEEDLRFLEGFSCEQYPPVLRVLTMWRRAPIAALYNVIRKLLFQQASQPSQNEDSLPRGDTTVKSTWPSWNEGTEYGLMLYALVSDMHPTGRGRYRYTFMHPDNTLDTYRDLQRWLIDPAAPEVIVLVMFCPLNTTSSVNPSRTSAKRMILAKSTNSSAPNSASNSTSNQPPSFSKGLNSDLMFPQVDDAAHPFLIFKWFDHQNLELFCLGARVCDARKRLEEYIIDWLVPLAIKYNLIEAPSGDDTALYDINTYTVAEECHLRSCQTVRRVNAAIKKINKCTGDVIIVRLKLDTSTSSIIDRLGRVLKQLSQNTLFQLNSSSASDSPSKMKSVTQALGASLKSEAQKARLLPCSPLPPSQNHNVHQPPNLRATSNGEPCTTDCSEASKGLFGDDAGSCDDAFRQTSDKLDNLKRLPPLAPVHEVNQMHKESPSISSSGSLKVSAFDRPVVPKAAARKSVAPKKKKKGGPGKTAIPANTKSRLKAEIQEERRREAGKHNDKTFDISHTDPLFNREDLESIPLPSPPLLLSNLSRLDGSGQLQITSSPIFPASSDDPLGSVGESADPTRSQLASDGPAAGSAARFPLSIPVMSSEDSPRSIALQSALNEGVRAFKTGDLHDSTLIKPAEAEFGRKLGPSADLEVLGDKATLARSAGGRRNDNDTQLAPSQSLFASKPSVQHLKTSSSLTLVPSVEESVLQTFPDSFAEVMRKDLIFNYGEDAQTSEPPAQDKNALENLQLLLAPSCTVEVLVLDLIQAAVSEIVSVPLRVRLNKHFKSGSSFMNSSAPKKASKLGEPRVSERAVNIAYHIDRLVNDYLRGDKQNQQIIICHLRDTVIKLLTQPQLLTALLEPSDATSESAVTSGSQDAVKATDQNPEAEQGPSRFQQHHLAPPLYHQFFKSSLPSDLDDDDDDAVPHSEASLFERCLSPSHMALLELFASLFLNSTLIGTRRGLHSLSLSLLGDEIPASLASVLFREDPTPKSSLRSAESQQTVPLTAAHQAVIIERCLCLHSLCFLFYVLGSKNILKLGESQVGKRYFDALMKKLSDWLKKLSVAAFAHVDSQPHSHRADHSMLLKYCHWALVLILKDIVSARSALTFTILSRETDAALALASLPFVPSELAESRKDKEAQKTAKTYDMSVAAAQGHQASPLIKKTRLVVSTTGSTPMISSQQYEGRRKASWVAMAQEYVSSTGLEISVSRAPGPSSVGESAHDEDETLTLPSSSVEEDDDEEDDDVDEKRLDSDISDPELFASRKRGLKPSKKLSGPLPPQIHRGYSRTEEIDPIHDNESFEDSDFEGQSSFAATTSSQALGRLARIKDGGGASSLGGGKAAGSKSSQISASILSIAAAVASSSSSKLLRTQIKAPSPSFAGTADDRLSNARSEIASASNINDYVDRKTGRPLVSKDLPCIVYESRTWFITYKPAFWHCSGPTHCVDQPLNLHQLKQGEIEKTLCSVDDTELQYSGRMESFHLWLMKRFPNQETIKRWTELECGLCHRIDLETSGAVLIARTRRTRDYLWDQFRRRNVHKEYLLLCHGRIRNRFGVVKTRLLTKDYDSRSRIKSHFTQVVEEGGDDSLTEYHVCRVYKRKKWGDILASLISAPPTVGEYVLPSPNRGGQKPCGGGPSQASDDDRSKKSAAKLPVDKKGRIWIDTTLTGELTADDEFSLCKCRIVTGRTHQIRVHMRHIGHPLVSDTKYLEPKKCLEDRQWCPRMFLHAAILEFADPDSPNTYVESLCPLAHELVHALNNYLICVEDYEGSAMEQYGIPALQS